MTTVEPYTVPEAGVDTVDITLEETYEIEGVGRDTVVLKGTLVAERATPLYGHGRDGIDWESSTVVARFTSLDVRGESKVFGPVRVTLDKKGGPSFGVVRDGKCAAAIGVTVSMPDHKLTLRSAEPVQLRSEVTTVPPIGDERTESVGVTKLVAVRGRRAAGTIESARVVWRELAAQVEFADQ